MQITERTYRWARPLVARAGGPKGIVWHHSAAASSSAAEIHRWHIGRGWSGIGYHFVVRRSGMIERGRPENTIGSHTLGINERIGVCCEGNLQTQTMTAAQKESVAWLQAYLVGKYGNLPTTRHRDHASTACPGANFPWPIPKAAPTPTPPAKEDVVYQWIDVFGPSSSKAQLTAKAKALGLKLIVRAGDVNRAIYSVHTDKPRGDEFASYAGSLGITDIRRYPGRDDNSVRRLNSPTGTVL